MEIAKRIKTRLARLSPLQRWIGLSVVLIGLLSWWTVGSLLDRAPGQTSSVAGAGGFSLFESDFWLSGNSLSEEQELRPEFAVLLEEINPRTGEPFSEEAARKVQFLAGMFPENELIPRPDIPDYKEQRAERAREHEERGYLVAGGDATPADIEAYYGRISKVYGDQIELLEYALGNEEIPEEYRVRMEKMLSHSNEVQGQLIEQKQRSLAILQRRNVEDP